ncbi:hypothetical protein CYLTODRAFT_460657 [Cylindrobasidium torrendii FP15055 ss-10]|uniref:Uncharacterized protein n=1 Tax=Cylindrobasidium torrendii FP15055 ss-10 TaxID=1314674 RepID=A0A0D7ARY0_9AGAR|nr:hypothetical protein CYLTODRAFT_460657 [Cylindrobasidium torrendii FP15055 ss-10]
MASQPVDEEDNAPPLPQAMPPLAFEEDLDPALAAIGPFAEEAPSRAPSPAPLGGDEYQDTFPVEDEDRNMPDLLFDDNPFADFDADVVDATTTGSKRKRAPDSVRNIDDDVRRPVNKKAQGGPGGNPPYGTKVVSGEFDPDLKLFARHVKYMMRAHVVNEQAYVNPYDKKQHFLKVARHTAFESQFACDAHVATLRNLLRDPEATDRVMTWVDYAVQAMRATMVNLTRKDFHVFGLVPNGGDARDVQRQIMEGSHWMAKVGAWAFGDVNISAKTFDPVTYAQHDIISTVASNLLLVQRSRLDGETFVQVMDSQEIPNRDSGVIKF